MFNSRTLYRIGAKDNTIGETNLKGLMTIIVVRAEDQALRLSCKMSLEDEDQLRAALADKKPHNLEIRAVDLWFLLTANNGSTILIKEKEHHEV